nr:single-stranded DNA-binding protein [Saprospiraceae bacterium]
MYNKVILIGNLGKDPEIRALESGVNVARFPIATNESYKDKSGEWQQKTEWHDIVAWRGLADRAERDLKKGTLVFIEGKITHRKYQDKDGIDRYITDIVAYTIKPMEKIDRGTNDSGNFPPVESETTRDNTGDDSSNDSGAEDDDLPF